ncbi:MAG: glycosyltransferase [Phycisphaerales bacterium]|nr:glycosyltransferase [Phycisphaerales bacterium]
MSVRITRINKTLIYLAGRIIKLTANTLKLVCYAFHFFFPRKRFTLPKKSGPIFRWRVKTSIPCILWQTNFTDRVTLPLYLNYLWNRILAFNYEYRFVDDETADAFIKKHFPGDVYDLYAMLQIGAAKADFWRLLVLYKRGGVYLDMDANLVWPLGSILRPYDQELYITISGDRISNYFIASKPNNDNLKKMISTVKQNIEENSISSVYELTGPGVFDQVLEGIDANFISYRYVCSQGNFSNEYFQYIDSKQGKWTHAQHKMSIVKNSGQPESN